jgi:hypothetical protein
MRTARLSLAIGAMAALSAIGIAACGSSSDNGQDQKDITAVITRAAASGDPAACTDSQTAKFTQQTSGEPGQSSAAAVKSCEQDAASSKADAVQVSDVEVDGDSATAKAKVTGSVFDGQTLDVALVKEDGKWKLDEFKGFEGFNRASFIAAFKKQLEAVPNASPQAVDCVVQQFQAASQSQIEGFFTGNRAQSETALFGPCSKYFQG